MTLKFFNNRITLTVNANGRTHSKVLTHAQLITLISYVIDQLHESDPKKKLYYYDDSLFYTAYELFLLLDDEELLEFIHYTPEDWDHLADFVQELYERDSRFLVNCRKN